MKEVRFFYVPEAATSDTLPADESQHALRVLRLKCGDEIMLMDGRGYHYRATLTFADGKQCRYAIEETLPQEPQWMGRMRLVVAPTKMMERMEWLVEKAVEVGVDEIAFVDCQFSERRVIKTERLEKIAVAAMKQSHKAWKPTVSDIVSFKRFIGMPRTGRKYIAHCYNDQERKGMFSELRDANPTEDITVMIGPEGDFSAEEVRLAVTAGYVPVDLGRSRLRTETAALAAVMMFQIQREIPIF